MLKMVGIKELFLKGTHILNSLADFTKITLDESNNNIKTYTISLSIVL